MVREIAAAVLACALSAGLAAPSRAAEPSAWEQVKTYSVEKKNDAVAFGRKLVQETDAKIQELDTQIARSSGEVKAAHQKNMEDLKAKRAAAAARLDDMGKATGSAWESTKQGFADAYRSLHEAYDDAAAKLKK